MTVFRHHGRPVSALSRLYLERQKNHFRIHSVACSGTEVHLAACPLEFSKANATSACRGGTAAVVSCMPGPLFMQSNGMKKKTRTSVKSSFKSRDSNFYSLTHYSWKKQRCCDQNCFFSKIPRCRLLKKVPDVDGYRNVFTFHVSCLLPRAT